VQSRNVTRANRWRRQLSPAFKYSKFQTTSTDPKFITHTRTNEAFLERKKPEKETYKTQKVSSEKIEQKKRFYCWGGEMVIRRRILFS
jgi:hypothetical protein